MAIQLEELVARLRLDSTGIEQGLGRVNSSLGNAGASATNAGKKMSVGMTAPLLAIGAASVNLAGNFDRTMRQVGIATDGPTGKLKELAMTMGAETSFSAGEAADAMLELAKGGMTAAQIQGGALAATMKLASAGGVDLASSSTYVSNAMAAFGLKAKDADAVTVALAGAANASSASVESLGMGLAQGSAAARNYGLSLQETTGVLSLFDAQGLKGADAGTSLKSMLNSLIPTTTKARDAMSRYNLSFVDAQGNFVGVRDMAAQLKSGLGGLTEAQRAQALETIFGSDGMRAATALMNGGAKAVDRYTKASYDSTTTTKLADAAMQGVSGAMERAKGSIETVGIIIGTVLAPYVSALAGFVERAANAFGGLPRPVQAVAIALAAVAAAAGPLLIAIGFISTGLAAVSLPVVAVVAGLALLAGALVAAYASSARFRAVVQQAMGAVAAFIQSSVVPAARSIGTAFMQLVGVVTPIVMQIVGVVRSQLPQIANTARSVFASVRTIITSAMSIVRSVITVATRVISALWSTFGSTILSTISRVMSALQQVIRGAFNVISGIFRTVAAALRGDWSGMWDGIKQIAQGAGQILAGIVRGAFAIIRGIFSGAIAALVAIARAIWSGITGAFRAGVETAVAVVRAVPEKIRSIFAGAASMLVSVGADIVQGLVNGIQSAAGRVYDAAMSLVDKIPGPIRKMMGIASPSKVMHVIGTQITEGLALGMTDAAPKVTAATDAVADAVDNLGKVIEKRLDKVWDGKRLDKHVDAVRKAMRDETQAVQRNAANYDRLVAKYNATREAGIEAYDKIVERVDAARDALEKLQTQQSDYAASIASSVVDFGSVVSLGTREDEAGTKIAATAQTIIEDLRVKTQQAETFQRTIADLTSQGVNDTTLRQLLAAGVDGGLAAAQAIQAGGAGAITEINALTTQLAGSAATMGSQAAGHFYSAGVNAAAQTARGIENEAASAALATQLVLTGIATQIETSEGNLREKLRKLGNAGMAGLIEGLEDSKKIKQVAKKLADELRDEVKKALGIKSPSRVFRVIGHQTGEGMELGLLDMRKAIGEASARMALSAVVDPPQLSPAAIRSAAQLSSSTGTQLASMAPAATSVRVFIGERELTDIVRVEVGDTLAPLRTFTRQGG